MSKSGRERDAEVARETIMEAGEKVFASEGFDGARIDSIAAESGYNKSLIFHYFGDKEGLYRAIITRVQNSLREEYLEPLKAFVESSDEITTDRLRLLIDKAIRKYLIFLTDHPYNLRMIAWEAAEGWCTFMKDPAEELEPHKVALGYIIDFLHRAQEKGLINQKLDIHFLKMSMVNLCTMHLLSISRDRWFFEKEIGNNPADPLESVNYIHQQILQLILNGIVNQ